MPLATQRHQLILSELSRNGSLRTSDLALTLGISEMTIRRDLAELESRQLLQRVHGGAVLELSPQDTYVSRDSSAIYEKNIIAKKVVEHLENLSSKGKSNKVVYLDAGTTAMAVARAICQSRFLHDITLVTHAINIACFFASQGKHRLHVIGGEIYQNTFSSFGSVTLKSIQPLHFDLFLAGASGFNEKLFMNTNYVEIAVKQAVIERSNEVWMMINSGKWQCNYAAICGYEALSKLFVGPNEHPEKSRLSKKYPSLQIITCA